MRLYPEDINLSCLSGSNQTRAAEQQDLQLKGGPVKQFAVGHESWRFAQNLQHLCAGVNLILIQHDSTSLHSHVFASQECRDNVPHTARDSQTSGLQPALDYPTFHNCLLTPLNYTWPLASTKIDARWTGKRAR